jgi:glycosyltransferase involved in cell wall biosynthesis
LKVHVLHVLRSDHAAHLGGDLVQLQSSVQALCELGVEAVAAPLDDASFGSPPDIVHLYNLQRPADLAADVSTVRRRWPQARLVLSPIYGPAKLLDPVLAANASALWRATKSTAKDRLYWARSRRMVRSVDAVLPNSITELRWLSRHYRVRPTVHWRVVPNGAWIDRWPVRQAIDRQRQLTAWGLDPNLSALIACVARVEPRKNQRTLVRAVADLPGTGLLLVGLLAGEPYDRSVVALGLRSLPGRFACTGPLSQAEVADLLTGVDVHALPSFLETPGLATIEAAAVGCEIVTTPVFCTREYFGDDAHLAASPRKAYVARALADALREPRQPGLRHRIERYDWRQTGAMLLDAYRDLLQGN